MLPLAALLRLNPLARRRAGAELARPDDLAASRIEAEGEQLVAVLAGGEDRVAPDGRRAGAVGQRALPDDVLPLVPIQGDVRFGANAVAGGAAPLRPVAGDG